MNYETAKEICQKFASDHKVVFNEEGECGFGRECVGFSHGDSWIDHNPHTRVGNYDRIEKYECEACEPPDGVNAYHKHDCLAVLGRGEESVIQLATWVKNMQAQGTVEIVSYPTGATGIQAMISGVLGKTVIVRK